jgi:hypothetical protein
MSLNPFDGIASIGEQVKGILGKFFADKDKVNEAAFELAKLDYSLLAKQSERNQAAIQAGDIWNSGWIGLIGWCMGCCFIYLAAYPILMPVMHRFYDIDILPLDWRMIIDLTCGMLGLKTLNLHFDHKNNILLSQQNNKDGE